ncbi:MAG: molybdopterin adenylyltransferase [Balneolaceae bacterium]|nr:molybdopterin adenylyltransferase [Balneolaceae bacterium]MCH8547834.1 molybdopterin adenylyltransferase [Balneolaceae bacterium]
METVSIGIITLSDRASRGEYDDLSGPEIRRYFSERLKNTIEWHYEVIPDEPDRLKSLLTEMSDNHIGLICTTGGTGPAPRDITPQVTEEVCDKILPGFGEEMRRVSLQVVPTAILSAQTAGIRKKSLIINLPGKPKAIAECLDGVYAAIPYCLDLIGAPRMEFTAKGSDAFRPKKK